MPRATSDITFVGVGAIGLPMATLLARGGHRVTAVDPSADARSRAEAAGMASAARLPDALPDALPGGIVVVMVATPTQLSALVDEAIATGAAAEATWVVMSTVGPAAVVDASSRLAATGAVVVDAPVTGGVARARTGHLTIFASGPAETLSDVAPVLSLMGSVRPVGDRAGDGQSIKVVNQHLCAVHAVAAAEALALADRLGLDPSAVLPLVESGAAGSWMLSDRGPRMLAGTDVEVTSRVDIFVKDTGLVAEAAARSGASTPMLDVARDRFRAAAQAGLGARDDSRVIETYTAPA